MDVSQLCSCGSNHGHGARDTSGHGHAWKRGYEFETVLIEKKILWCLNNSWCALCQKVFRALSWVERPTDWISVCILTVPQMTVSRPRRLSAASPFLLLLSALSFLSNPASEWVPFSLICFVHSIHFPVSSSVFLPVPPSFASHTYLFNKCYMPLPNMTYIDVQTCL